MMQGLWTIFRREMAAYFTSPLAYLIGAGFLLLTGITFNNEIALALGTRPASPSLIPNLLTQVMIFFAPLLTMRLLAEESHEGTLELLLTAPITDSAIVLGKFLSAWCFYSILLLSTLSYQFILAFISYPDLAHTFSAYVGVWLYGGATLAVGLVFSATTDNQLTAAFISSVALLLLYFGDNVGRIVANLDLAAVIFNLTLLGHYSPSFAEGVMRAEDVVYYAGVMAVMLFIAIRLVEAKR